MEKIKILHAFWVFTVMQEQEEFSGSGDIFALTLHLHIRAVK